MSQGAKPIDDADVIGEKPTGADGVTEAND
jgi:hypothetical protein